MKKLLYLVGSSLLKKFLLQPSGPNIGSHSASLSQLLPKFNTDYLSDIAKKYALALGIGLTFSLFFVSGISMSLFSAAQSFDLFGIFVPGAVFFTGIGLAAVSLIVVGVCISSIRNTKLIKERLYLMDEVSAPAVHTPLEYVALAQPFFQGLKNGWRKERDKRYYARSQTEPFPPDENLGRRDRENVTEFRTG